MADRSEYLLAVYIEQNREAPVSFERIGELLDRSGSTVTEMCQRLDEEGLLEYEQYEGVTLTEDGERAAADCHERYVILSWFFRSVLDLEDHERTAMEMAGTVSPETAGRLAALPPHVEGSRATVETDIEE